MLWPMNSISLFIKAFDDLETKSKSGDWYEYLQCARLLRQLLLDPHPLFVAANWHEKMRIRFEVLHLPRRKPDLILLFQMSTLDPEATTKKERRMECNSSQSLNNPVCCCLTSRTPYVISFCTSNTQGAVHHGRFANTATADVARTRQGLNALRNECCPLPIDLHNPHHSQGSTPIAG